MLAGTSVGAGTNSQVEALEGRRLLSVAVHAELHRPPTAFADFNGDGTADILVAVADRGGGGGGAGGLLYLRVLTNNGDLSFTRTSETPLKGLPAGDVRLAVADLDRDGDMDVACAGFGESGEVGVGTLLNDGKGGLQPAGGSTAKMAINRKGTGAAGFAAGDLDGDGRDDLVAWAGGEIAVFAGDGKGGVGDARKGVNPLYEDSGKGGTNPLYEKRVAGVADLDGDGRAELIGFDRSGVLVARVGSFDPLVFRLAKPGTIAAPNVPIDDLLIGDVDGDGRPDLVAISGGQVQFGLNTGGKSDIGPIRWMPPESLRLSPVNVSIGDLDGDGRAELFATVSNVLKTKHDTVKNSINNVR